MITNELTYKTEEIDSDFEGAYGFAAEGKYYLGLGWTCTHYTQ